MHVEAFSLVDRLEVDKFPMQFLGSDLASCIMGLAKIVCNFI